MNLSSSQLKAIGNVLTFAAVVLLAWVFSDMVIKIWPIKVGELNWRVGFTGLFIESTVAALPAITMLFVSAFIGNQRAWLRVLSVIMLVLGVMVIGMLLGFALDATQLRATIPQNLKGTFTKAVFKASLGGILLGCLLPWTFVTLNKVLKSQGTARAGVREKESPDSGNLLMVGNRGETPARPSLRAIDPTKEIKEIKDAAKDVAKEVKELKTSGPTELAVDL
jgi:hypothetical protein